MRHRTVSGISALCSALVTNCDPIPDLVPRETPNRNVYRFNRHCWSLAHVTAVRARSSRPPGTSLTGRANAAGRRLEAGGCRSFPGDLRRVGLLLNEALWP